jgi:hypothetical protein
MLCNKSLRFKFNQLKLKIRLVRFLFMYLFDNIRPANAKFRNNYSLVRKLILSVVGCVTLNG